MKTFSPDGLFGLEGGTHLHGLQVTYHTVGHLNTDGSNVVWVCHALTANSDVLDWWNGLFGIGNYYDPEKYFIVCANVIGSCYGTTGPLSINPITGKPYYQHFPLITIRDMVKAHQLLQQHLGIKKIHTLIGGSMGGFQAMEWAIENPDICEQLVLIATAAKHSPWGVAYNEAQRMAIEADITWGVPSAQAATKGLRAARAIALLSYRHYDAYGATQNAKDDEQIDGFPAAAYQRYQGEKLVKRFDAYSYYSLTKSMDSHNVGRNRKPIERSLGLIKARTIVIGIDSDQLFPPSEQAFLAKHIPDASLHIIDSSYGHDGFLVETKKLTSILQEEEINVLSKI